MPVKVALPKGRLLRKTAALLHKAGWDLDEYHSSMGFYRPKSKLFPEVFIRVFHEKDIPIQIAMGNYDLGICGLDWVEELLVKYPKSSLIKIKDLVYGDNMLLMAAAAAPEELEANGSPVRIASEYPNLAEAYALRKRMGRFSVFQLWGAAEVYPPENADMVLLPAGAVSGNIVPFDKVLNFSAFLIANRNSWECKELDNIITSICDVSEEVEKRQSITLQPENTGLDSVPTEADRETIRLALPDGHQQQPTVEILNKAGIIVNDYPSDSGNRRPTIRLEGVSVKVIRPQDMPLQVANGNFDLAITGRDWLTEHLNQFPSSPVEALVDLGFARVRLVAVVSQELAVNDTAGLQNLIAGREMPLRVASEYVNIADRYARDNRLGHYRVIPTWGASEAFLPDDADLLIENTETGRTIARHNLKIIDTLFVSTGHLIGNSNVVTNPDKRKKIKDIVERLKTAVENA